MQDFDPSPTVTGAAIGHKFLQLQQFLKHPISTDKSANEPLKRHRFE